MKAVGNSTIQKSAYKFLLAFHSNYVPNMHHFWDIARHWSKKADFNLLHLIWHPRRDDFIRISTRSLSWKKAVKWI